MATDATKQDLDNTSKEGEEPVTFDEKQQAKINAILAADRRKLEEKAQAELKASTDKIVALHTELEELKTKGKTLDKNSKEGKDSAESIEAIKNELEEAKRANRTVQAEKDEIKKQFELRQKDIDSTKQEMINLRKRFEIRNAIQKFGAFSDPDLAEMLLDRSVKYDSDSDSFVVINEKGLPRLTSTMEPMSVDELCKETAKNRKGIVKAELISGTGSTENKSGFSKGYKLEDLFGPKSNGKMANDLAINDYPKYKELQRQAREKGLIK